MSFQTKSEPLQMSIDKFNNSPRDDVGGSWMSSTLTYCFPEEALLRKQRTSQPQNTQDLCIGIAELMDKNWRGQNALCYYVLGLVGREPSLHHMQINAPFFDVYIGLLKKQKEKLLGLVVGKREFCGFVACLNCIIACTYFLSHNVSMPQYESK